MSRHMSLSLLRSCTILHKSGSTELKTGPLQLLMLEMTPPQPPTRAESEHTPLPHLCHIT